MKTLLILASLVLSTSAIAQTQLNSNQVGQFGYTNGTVNGQPYNSTTNQVGQFGYTNGTIGGKPFNCTTSQIGQFKTTNCQ